MEDNIRNRSYSITVEVEVENEQTGTNPFAFTGGRIVKAIVDVSGEPFVDLEKEAVAMMARE